MGTLRIILALIVLFGHSCPGLYSLKVSTLAVETFFMISGFYMELVIGEYATTGAGWIRRFYASRLMRLMPLYWMVLLCTILFIILSHADTHVSNDRQLCRGRADAVAICWATNLFIVGHDVLQFTYFDTAKGQFHFWIPPEDTTDRDANLIPGERFNLISQSWSLAPELMFYALVPFLLLRSTGVLVGLTLASMALKLALVASSVNYALTYALPAELGVFLMGALVCRYAKTQISTGEYTPPWTPILVIYGFVYIKLLILCGPLRYGNFAFLGMTAAYLPSLLRFSLWSKRDRHLGEYSYPIYLVHNLFVYLLSYGTFSSFLFSLAAVTLSVLFAAAYVRWIDRPLTRFRHDRLRRSFYRT